MQTVLFLVSSKKKLHEIKLKDMFYSTKQTLRIYERSELY